MKRSMMMIAVLVLVVLAGTARADGIVQARSDVPAKVFVDGAFVGTTPIDVVIPRRGNHEVRFRARGGTTQSFFVQVPGRSRTVTPLFANLVRHCAPVVAATPLVVAPRPIVIAQPYYGGYRGRYWR